MPSPTDDSARQRTMLKIAAAVLGMAVALPLAAAQPLEVGLGIGGSVIEGSVVPGASGDVPTILLIGGLGDDAQSTALVREELRAFEETPEQSRSVRLLAIPLANPDGAHLQFPPTGVAYRENTESHALWRWTGLHAPDLVLIAGNDSGLGGALAGNAVAEVGRIPVHRLSGPGKLQKVAARELQTSEARRELARRRARTPRQLAEELAEFYGHDFNQPWYIEAIALIARMRLGQVEDVKRLVEPYVDGSKDSLERPNSLVLAGHIVFTDLARRTGDPRYVQAVRKVGDMGFDQQGRMLEAMPYHHGYSDSIFMGTVIAAQAGALTGERRYFDLAARHLAFMQQRVLRADGLYRHHPETDAAWGRGNAFAAIGLAMTLAEFPKSHPAHAGMLRSYQELMAVLSRFQNQDGLWRNVIDHPGAFAEFSATAMIGYSMLLGVHGGWLPAEQYQPVIDRAWRAVVERVGADGRVVDVCESTSRIKTLDEYLKRAAILGQDARGGAMAMLFATELAGLR